MQEAALARGLLVLTAGMGANVIRTLTPLTIPEAVLGEGLAILESAVDAAAG